MIRNVFSFWRFLLILGGMFMVVNPMEAQTARVQFKVQTEEGNDSVILRRLIIKSQSPYEMQKRINVLLKGDSIVCLTPEHVLSYKVGSKLYTSVWMPNEKGGTEHVFLQQVYNKPEHSVSVYLYQDSLGNERRFWGLRNEPLQPLVEGKDGSHPMKAYLRSFPLVGQSELLEEYIDKMRPDEKSFHKRARICWTDNLNWLPRFRWGVSALANINSVKMDETQVNQVQAGASLWADVPLGACGLTFHPELSFNKVSALQRAHLGGPMDVAYNHTMLTLPVMLRYTAVYLRGNVLPYLEGGAFAGYALKHELLERGFERNEENFAVGFWEQKNEGQQMTLGFLAGMGVEIRLMPRHSLWVGGRYYKQLDHKTNMYNVSLNGGQMYVSFNF